MKTIDEKAKELCAHAGCDGECENVSLVKEAMEAGLSTDIMVIYEKGKRDGRKDLKDELLDLLGVYDLLDNQ